MLLVLLACTPPEPPASPTAEAPPLFSGELPLGDLGDVPGLATLSAQTCAGCHVRAHDDWVGSAHATAWTSPTFRAAVAAAGDSTMCLGCHLPLRVQHEELADGYLDGDVTRPRLVPNPAFDATLQSEGVTCVVCHVRDGVVLSANPPQPAPHPTVQSAELRDESLCATCHELSWPGGDRPFYDTVGEWEKAGFKAGGVQCRACHMAERDGEPGHTFHLPAARALTTLVQLPSTRVTPGQPLDVTVTLVNTGAGHSVPSGNPFSTWTIDAALVDAGGHALTDSPVLTLARTIDDAPPWNTRADTRLAAGERRDGAAHLVVPGGFSGGSLVVRLHVGDGVETLRSLPLRVE